MFHKVADRGPVRSLPIDSPRPLNLGTTKGRASSPVILRCSSPLLSNAAFFTKNMEDLKREKRVGYYGFLLLFASGQWTQTGTKNEPVCWQSGFPVLEVESCNGKSSGLGTGQSLAQ